MSECKKCGELAGNSAVWLLSWKLWRIGIGIGQVDFLRVTACGELDPKSAVAQFGLIENRDFVVSLSIKMTSAKEVILPAFLFCHSIFGRCMSLE